MPTQLDLSIDVSEAREAFWRRLHLWGSGIAATRYGERGWQTR